MGSGVNIGCGTITCNYDGVHKYQTTIEDGAFIGSNTNLVAPVTVEANAFIGAGSTITRDVAANALALTRAELRVKEKLAEKVISSKSMKTGKLSNGKRCRYEKEKSSTFCHFS